MLIKNPGCGWTPGRSPVPPLLAAAGVPPEAWAATFDAATDFNGRLAGLLERRWWCCLLLLPALAFAVALFTMGLAMGAGWLLLVLALFRVGERNALAACTREWQRHVESEKVAYLRYGIKVDTLVQTIWPGPRKYLIIGGLEFALSGSAEDGIASSPNQPISPAQNLEALPHLAGGVPFAQAILVEDAGEGATLLEIV